MAGPQGCNGRIPCRHGNISPSGHNSGHRKAVMLLLLPLLLEPGSHCPSSIANITTLLLLLLHLASCLQKMEEKLAIRRLRCCLLLRLRLQMAVEVRQTCGRRRRPVLPYDAWVWRGGRGRMRRRWGQRRRGEGRRGAHGWEKATFLLSSSSLPASLSLRLCLLTGTMNGSILCF